MTRSPISGMYFEGDIEMSAKSIVEMFGDEAPLRARERAGEYTEKDGEDGPKFWLAVADAAVKLLEKEPRGDG